VAILRGSDHIAQCDRLDDICVDMIWMSLDCCTNTLVCAWYATNVTHTEPLLVHRMVAPPPPHAPPQGPLNEEGGANTTMVVSVCT
jgi:hypothetical protein